MDENKPHYVNLLREAVEIKSVSAWPETRQEIVKMVHWVGDRLKKLGSTVEYRDVGEQVRGDIIKYGGMVEWWESVPCGEFLC